MQQVYVDFNTLNSEPVGVVKVGQVGIDQLPPLHAGEQVMLYDEEMEVVATIGYDPPSAMWLATPDWSTRHNLADASATV